MNYASLLAGSLGCLVVGSAAHAQSFSFPNFASVSGLTLNGSAVQSGTNLRITNNGSANTGSAWYTMPVSVTEGFDTTFSFIMTTGPEGMAFVIQGSPAGASAIGGGIWGLGYGYGVSGTPITNSIAIEIDAAQTVFCNDTSANEVSIHTSGAFGNSENEGVSIARITPATDLSNNAVHTMRVTYTPGVGGAAGSLAVYVNNLVTPLLTTPFSFENGGTQLTGGSTGGLGLSGPNAWVGFTSSTASGPTGHNAEIRSWNWTSYFLPHPCYTGNVLAGSTGPHDVLRLNNTAGGFFRTLNLFIADPFSFSVAPPPGETSAPFVLLFNVGVASAATATPTTWGTACFPLVNVLDIGSFVAPYSVTVPPGLALTIPFTFQALMNTSSINPSQVELTNAVALQFAAAPAPSITSVSPNSAAPGGTITIAGANFSPYATVDINFVPVTPLSVSATTITFPMPASVACGATLRVRNPDAAQATIVFNPTPAVTSQLATSGPAAGGTNVIIIGTGFAPGTTMTFGGNPGNVTTASATVLICVSPPGTAGPSSLVITTPGGCSITRPWTYL